MKKALFIFLACCCIFILSGCCSHEWQEATCTEPKTCTKCGATEGEALGHDYSEWQVTKEATYSAEGEQEQTCSRCGDVVKEAIPQKSLEGATIVDEQGFCVTDDEFFELFEGFLNAETSNYKTDDDSLESYDLIFNLTKDKNDSMRSINCTSSGVDIDLDTTVMLGKSGEEPGADGSFNQVTMIMIGTKDQIEERTWFYHYASLLLIKLTDPSITSYEEAYDLEREIASYCKDNDGWYKYGDYEYTDELMAMGKSGNDVLYFLTFGARHVE